MYEHFDHTADLGLRIKASGLPELFADAAKALFAALVERPEEVKAAEIVTISVSGDELSYLLFDWLRELLFLFESEHWLFARFEVKIDGRCLRGNAWGEKMDPTRHLMAHEVKAITYHGLKVEQQADGGWLAEVIVDI